jgi:cytochrome c nitrite reductase small subunit
MRWAVLIGLASLALVAGIGLYVSDFTVYLGNDPTACNNCHVMDAAYEGWFHSGHKQWASCNDCHTPHDFIPKYLVKAESGYHHVTAFTFGNYPVNIRAKESTREIIQENCIRCHAETVANVADGQMDAGRYCVDCHRSVAHGERGVSILPYQDK